MNEEKSRQKSHEKSITAYIIENTLGKLSNGWFPLSVSSKVSKKAATPRKAAGPSGSSPKKTVEKKKTEQTSRKEDREERQTVPSKDDAFREFRRVCSNVADVDAYTDKTAIIKRMFTQGADGGKHRFFYQF